MSTPMADDQHLQSEEDVEAILRLAVQQSGEAPVDLRQRLQSTADELGITPEQLAVAEKEYRAKRDTELEAAKSQETEKADWKEFRRTQYHEFLSHFVTYLAVNGGLVGMDLFSNGRLDWAVWPILGWGIAVAIHALSLLAAYSEDNVKEFEKWRKKKYRRKKPTTGA